VSIFSETRLRQAQPERFDIHFERIFPLTLSSSKGIFAFFDSPGQGDKFLVTGSDKMQRRVAFITGASRGIGRASAVALAEKGFDVVVTARTLTEGKTADGRPLPGSVESTAAEVRKRGREALPLYLDLLERSSIDTAVQRTMEEWGHVDVLLNNGIYTGEGSMVHILDLDLADVERTFQANLFAQIHLIQKLLPAMLDRNTGCVINMVSNAGINDPPAAAGKGGWGFAYAASKAAFHRMVGVLKVEHEQRDVRYFNLEPGFVMTEAMALSDRTGEISKRFKAAPTEVPAAVIAWLATDPNAAEWHGKTVLAQPLALKLGLVEDWR
jgi:NAD(P)-dependent dehydrogenase (short-subunit alcohol dehydrogenase family)